MFPLVEPGRYRDFEPISIRPIASTQDPIYWNEFLLDEVNAAGKIMYKGKDHCTTLSVNLKHSLMKYMEDAVCYKFKLFR